MKKSLTWSETLITAVIKTCGYSAIVFVMLIFFFLLREGLPTLARGEARPTVLHPLVSRSKTISASCR